MKMTCLPLSHQMAQNLVQLRNVVPGQVTYPKPEVILPCGELPQEGTGPVASAGYGMATL